MVRQTKRIPVEKGRIATSLDGSHSIMLGIPIAPGYILEFDEGITKIRSYDVFDLPMIRGEIDSVQERYQELTGGPLVDNGDIHGVFVSNKLGDLFQIQADFADTVEHKSMAEGKAHNDPKRYFPASRLPYDAELVVRTEALREFEASLNQSNVIIESPEQRHERIKSHVDKAYADGKTKESAYKELAESENCSVQNIKRIYKR